MKNFMNFKFVVLCALALMTGSAVYGQDNVIDEVVWVVGDEAILKSEVEEARMSAAYEGRITACTHNVNRAVSGKIYRYAGGEQCFTETYQFFYFDAAHLENGQQGGYLCVVIHSPGYVEQQILCFFSVQFLVIEEAG